jgi:hypothetical protein
LSTVLLLAVTGVWAQHDVATGENTILPADHPAIQYFDREGTDAVARLSEQIANGAVRLEFDKKFGYLPSVLKHLDVNVDSQMLVFSKTSFQAAKISPREPRSIFFNDTVTVGYVQGSDVLEFAALDPKQGYVFYTFENLPSAKPAADRRDVCLQCHHGPATSGVPGIMIASVYPDSSGMPYARLGMPVTDQRTASRIVGAAGTSREPTAGSSIAGMRWRVTASIPICSKAATRRISPTCRRNSTRRRT